MGQDINDQMCVYKNVFMEKTNTVVKCMTSSEDIRNMHPKYMTSNMHDFTWRFRKYGCTMHGIIWRQ